METSQNPWSGVVQIRDTLRGSGYPDICAQSFSPYFWTSGLHWILKHFPSHEGPLTQAEIAQGPKIILVGHSAGGWVVMRIVRALERKGIPVELCILVDSVGTRNATVPKNVRTSALFYAQDVFLMLTTKSLKVEVPSRTRLLAPVVVKGANHESVTRDPRIRELVLNAVDSLRAAPFQAHREELGTGPISPGGASSPGPDE